MAELGMDTAGMDPMPGMIIMVTEEVRTIIDKAMGKWAPVKWVGTDANTWREQWETETTAIQTMVGQKMGQLAQDLRKNIIEQNTASGN